MRYLLLAGEQYYPAGGSDFVCTTESLAAAYYAGEVMLTLSTSRGSFLCFEWFDVVDLLTGDVVEYEVSE